MPIFVQWKWKERTKSFLVIFHFFDDYSNPNLRIKDRTGLFDYYRPRKKAWMSWAPSHVELGLLGELLRYANIVDGLKESEKRELRNALEGKSAECIDDLWKGYLYRVGKRWALGSKFDPYFLVELCPEYVDYLKNLLKKYS